MQIALVATGALAQLFGIGLVAWPDAFPYLLRAAAWLQPRLRRGETRVRGWFGLKPRPRHYFIRAASDGISLSGRVSAVVGTSATDVSEQVEFLLRRDKDSQQRMDKVEERITNLESAMEHRLADLQGELPQQIAESLAVHRAVRILGAIALAVGLALTTLASVLY